MKELVVTLYGQLMMTTASCYLGEGVHAKLFEII